MSELAARLLRRDRSAVPEALNLVDDTREARRAEARALLDALEPSVREGGARRVGITGAPGSGKSTLLDALVRQLRAADVTIGLIAVDPSSQKSGGALLGDRVRVRSVAADPGVCFRSRAARSRLGGLADASYASTSVLAAAFDIVLVETVGVGQSEAEVAGLVDTLVFVAEPGAGDTLQFMKAGLLELPDVFAVNKCDLGPAAERTATELRAGLGFSGNEAGDEPTVLTISARDGDGVADLILEIERHGEKLAASGRLAARRQHAHADFVAKALERHYGSYGLEAVGGREAVLYRASSERNASAATLVEALSREIEDALRKPRSLG